MFELAGGEKYVALDAVSLVGRGEVAWYFMLKESKFRHPLSQKDAGCLITALRSFHYNKQALKKEKP